MKHVLFVDDEINVLDGLRRMFPLYTKAWQPEFVASSRAALAHVETHPVDAIVADMRMPEMNGAQLLRAVRDCKPGIVRFILTGYADQELICQTWGCAHRHFSKPCETEQLVKGLDSALALNDFLQNERIRKVVAAIPALPSLPTVYAELLAAINSETSRMDDIARIVARDVGISTRVIHVVNSALFGLQQRVDSVERAVGLLGLESLKNVVLSAGAFLEHKATAMSGPALEKIYTHSLEVAALCRTVAVRLGLDKAHIEEAMLAGMLHDVGKPIMLEHLAKPFARAMALAKETQVPEFIAEEEVLQVSHAQIGAYLLSLWGESMPIVASVAFHHCPGEAIDSSSSALSVVHVGNALARRSLYPDRDTWRITELDEKYVESQGLNAIITEVLADLERKMVLVH